MGLERVRDIEYQSISGSQYQSISGSQYGGGRERDDRTEIIIESSRAGSNRGGSNRGEDRRRRYYRDAY